MTANFSRSPPAPRLRASTRQTGGRPAAVRVLLVEDNPRDAELIILGASDDVSRPIDFQVCSTLAAAIAALHWMRIDIILADLNLPDSSGADTIESLSRAAPDVPLIAITGGDDILVAARCIEGGADEYLVKGPSNFISNAIYTTLARARSNRALQASHENLTRLLADHRDAILVVGADQEIRFANAAARWLFEEGALVGARFDRLPLGRAGPNYSLIDEGGRPRTLEFHQTATLWRDESATVLWFRDITDQWGSQAILAREGRLASMASIAAGLAHEINNPLTAVQSGLEIAMADLRPLLANDDIGQGVMDALGEALSGARRIQEITASLSAVAHLEHDQLEPVHVHAALEVALNLVGKELQQRARVEQTFTETRPVLANTGRLSRVFINLILNAAHALDATPAEDHEVHLRVWEEDSWVYAEVRDTGCGIKASDLERIFEPFFTTQEIDRGSGLGLATSRTIAEAFGGELTVTSRIGEGACFRLRLPALTVAPAAPDKRFAPAPVASTTGRVLVVDDDAALLRIYARILEAYEPVVVDSGAAAKTLLAVDQRFDLILCDMMMMPESGMDVHAWLCRELPVLADRLVFMTAGAFTPDTRAYLVKSKVPFLTKPVTLADLRAFVAARVAAVAAASRDED